jgi:hypothetical protein
VIHKSRLRPRRSPQLVPVAAEVLQTRALLSAGSAVHAAVNHAAVQTRAGETHALVPSGFHVSQNATIQLNGGTPSLLPVKFSISIKPVVGSKVTAHASAKVPVPGGIGTLKATWIGTVHSLTPSGGATDFVITPTGGSIVIKINAGGEHQTATALPNGTNSGAELFGKKFIDFNATNLFTPDSASLFANKTFKFDIDTL